MSIHPDPKRWPPDAHTPTCSLCGQPMVWEFREYGPDGYTCHCEDESTEYGECSSCGYSGPIGGECDECGCEIGS